MLDVYSGKPIELTVSKSNKLLEEYQASQALLKIQDIKESLEMVQSSDCIISLHSKETVSSIMKETRKEPRILEDADIGFMKHPVGSFMSTNIPLINVMAQNLIEHLEDFSVDYSDVCFVAQGSSGAIISALIAAQIPGSMIWDIKKPGQTSHSHHAWCVPCETKYMVFVDDFISSGTTFNRCYEQVRDNKRVIDCILVTGRVSWTIFEEHPVDVIICQEYNEQSNWDDV